MAPAHNYHVDDQLAVIPSPTPVAPDRTTPDRIDINSSAGAFGAIAYLNKIQLGLYHGILNKEGTVANLIEKLQKQKEEVARWKECYAQRGALVQELNNTIGGLESDNKRVVEEQAEAVEEVKALQQAHGEAVGCNQQLSQNLEEEKARLADLSSTNAKLQEDHDRLKASAASAEEVASNNSEAALKELNRARDELASVRKELKELREELKSAQANIKGETTARLEAERLRDEMEQKCKDALSNAASSETRSHEASLAAAAEIMKANRAQAELTRVQEARNRENRALAVFLQDRDGKRPLAPSSDEGEGPAGKRRRQSTPET